jgi:ParB family transcriptional regulator, chromosome partitioning protein
VQEKLNTVGKRSALGKGLGALLSDTDVKTRESVPASVNEAQSATPFIRIDLIETNPYQPRNEFDTLALNELAESIKVHGIIQPISLRKLGNKYQLISGERRFRASQIAGLTEVPAYVRTANDQEMLEMALIENIQRQDLNAMEIAISYQRMVDECGLKAEELGTRVGKDRSTVANYMRLLKLPPAIQSAIQQNFISMGHARALINIEGIDKQLYALNEVLTKELSVRKTEELAKSLLVLPKKEAKVPALKNSDFFKIQDKISSKLGTKVQMQADDKGKGTIKIEFLSVDDLNRILDLLKVQL